MEKKLSTTSSVDTLNVDQPGQQNSFGEPTANSISVEDAIQEYNELKRELSRISRGSTSHPESNLEKGATEEFKLDDFLNNVSESAQSAGNVPKYLGLVWKDLAIEGYGPDAYTVPTNLSYLISVLQPWRRLFGLGKGTRTSRKSILRHQSGFVKPGEMLLVLGRPGAGCTSLLKVLANMRSSFTRIDGHVSYGGIDANTFSKHYRGQVVYCAEEDIHYPTLTAKQTLQFAIRTKTPGNRLPRESKVDHLDKILVLLGKMLGLTRQMNTLVGDGFVRGLSGGERKRLSVAEAMTTQSSIHCWDCSTRGLDATSALDYVRSLRVMTDILKKTTIATLYQASNSIYSLFDKVLLLDDGYCLYFGPIEEAREYFENLGFYCSPRKSTPDFLTGLCNPLEREVKSGFEDRVPQYAVDFEERYRSSDMFKRMGAELTAFEDQIFKEIPADRFKQAVIQEHQAYAAKNSPFTASFYQQVKALTIRQYQLLIKDYDGLITRYGTILIEGLLAGSVFYKMPLTALGAFSRGGAFGFSVVFAIMMAETEMVKFLTGQPILEKHKHFAMYHPSAFYISQVILDIPFVAFQTILYAVCAYFLMGLNPGASHFFTFFTTLFFFSLTFNGIYRFCSALLGTFFLSAQAGTVVFITSYMYNGYFILRSTQHPWFGWIYWIDPFAYAFKALMVNEMDGRIFDCEGPGESIPYGPGYDDWEHRVCVMQGGNPGESFVRGEDYVRKELGFLPSQLWVPDIIVLIGFFLFFTVINALIMEYKGGGKSGTLTKLYLPGKAPKSRNKEEEDEHRRRRRRSIRSTSTNTSTSTSNSRHDTVEKMGTLSTGTVFSWQHVSYTIPAKGGHTQILNDISGIVKPGRLTALMGSSGAGKTTLLDVLSRRKTVGKVEGRVYLNNEVLMSDFERITGYCEQIDIHHPAITVREALRFSANLRQDPSVSIKEKDAYVEQIIELLEMQDIADAQIGKVDTGFGISIEERKRLTIGVELVAKPKLLFLDEPTSGLDAQSSYNIIRFIRKLANKGWPVLCTIHQPSSILFEHFDDLVLLVLGGRMAYHGPIGKEAHKVISYFESHGGSTCAPDANPAEYILEVVGRGGTAESRDWAQIWEKSDEGKSLQNELDQVHQSANHSPTRPALAYATPFSTQFVLVLKRMWLVYWRLPEYNVGRLITLCLIGLIEGFSFWKMGHSIDDMRNRLFFTYNSFVIGNALIVMGQSVFYAERVYFRRDYASRFYGWFPFGLSIALVEIPYVLLYSVLYMMITYWTVGLVNMSAQAGYFFIMLFVISYWSVMLGFILASLTESATVAAVLNPLITMMIALFCGLLQPASLLPRFWSTWMYWLSAFHYLTEGLSVNDMETLPIVCSEEDSLYFPPPAGQTCGQYLANHLSNYTGYVADKEATNMCRFCQYSQAKEYYGEQFGWSESNKWIDFGIVCGFTAFNIIVFFALCYWRKKGRR